MTDSPERAAPHLVHSLAKVARRNRVARKLVIAPNFAAGRELLRRLSLEGRGWIGFEVTTIPRLAHGIAMESLERAGLALLDAFEQQALIDRALDSALASEEGPLGDLSEGVGFRERVHAAIRELRAAGIGPRELDAARFAQWEKKLFLLRVLQRYERYLTQGRKADSAAVLRLALGALEAEGNTLPSVLDADVVSLLPGLSTRGLSGRLVSAICARGGKVLETDAVMGLEAPPSLLWNRRADPSPGSNLFAPEAEPSREPPLELGFVRAASVEAELREVLRRVLELGLPWDEVEIIAADPVAYGSAMHALSVRLGIPVTYAVGLPIARTRTGRVVQAYLDWVSEGFQASPIRRLLEAGDLRPSRSREKTPAAALARRFRALRIGWGRKRYRTQIRAALAGVETMERSRHETPEGFARKQERIRRELEALKSILFPALKATPAVPDRMGSEGDPVSPAELARGLRAFLRRVPRGRGPDRGAREEVGRILDRIEATITRRTDFGAAVTILRRHLDVRVRAELTGSGAQDAVAPWSSEGGALHLTDFQHGAYSGRAAAFMVGLDAERVPRGGVQDPVLLDSDRRVLGSMLPTAAEVSREQAFLFAALFARLRGHVTLSYCSWEATEARTVSPSSVLLHALRTSRSDGQLTFQDLHQAMERVVNALPAFGRPALDSTDVWMAALGSGAVMRTGMDAVRASFPPLDRGLTARTEREEGVPSAFHGVIEPRPEELDPRRNSSVVVSASRLESLGTCPMKYMHASVLRIYPPDDPELDPDIWLDNKQRGSLLHAVFDASLREAHAGGLKLDEPDFEALALRVLSERIDRLKDEVPTPGDGTLTRQTAALQEDVRSFVRMVREQAPECVALELTFGLGDDEPVRLELSGGEVRLRGAVDRVDHDLAGLHVVDYKTGVPRNFGAATFNGGRRLQHALYAHVVEDRLEGEVVDGQYHFPTRRGQNQAFSFERDRLDAVRDLLDCMFDGAAAGHFVPTNEPSDCTFCDFGEICRVRKRGYGKIDSPLAEWSKEQTNVGLWPAFGHLKKTRTYED